ncbi:MAG: hypothetical protein CL489_08385 [Acidobacteria bacterium]|nr:hypothetical protein [Acidobacteriota bacterium]|tara:strand:- start:59423 stop:59623 length:201 start_codon:yes stop_codon:yes gene_type:complete
MSKKDLDRIENMLVEIASHCTACVKNEIEVSPEDMDFGCHVDDAYMIGVNNGNAQLAKRILKYIGV